MQSFKSFNFIPFFINPSISFSKLELLLIHDQYPKKKEKESELKECGLKNCSLVWKSLIDFNEAFIPYSELQFFDWRSIVVHSPAGLMYIA